jgi:MGT family glycosyltransferase
MQDRPLTIVFLPESAYGPTNNCIGVGDVLRARGHRVVFASESSWKGRLGPLGFEERLVDLAAPSDEEEDAGAFWKEYIRETAPEFRKPTIDQLTTVIEPIYRELVDGARYAEPQLKDHLAEVQPDVVLEDNVVLFPALTTSGAAFVRIVSCNPLEVRDPGLPPTFSGYPEADRSAWDEFRAEADRVLRPLWVETNDWVVEQGAEPLPDLDFMPRSAHANLYVYPESAGYVRTEVLGPTWHRLDSSVRTTDGPFELPDELRDGEGGLIYLSLGSLGSADVSLMERLVEVLGSTPHRYIVSKGPQHAEYDLAENMWGEEFLPQTSILPLVDLVITHGGNNTVTESFHFGKPMIGLPLFWDQYDNAQRLEDTGSGIRLDTYRFTDEEMTGAIERLLGDDDLRHRLDDDGRRIRARDGVTRAADIIERVGREHADR